VRQLELVVTSWWVTLGLTLTVSEWQSYSLLVLVSKSVWPFYFCLNFKYNSNYCFGILWRWCLSLLKYLKISGSEFLNIYILHYYKLIIYIMLIHIEVIGFVYTSTNKLLTIFLYFCSQSSLSRILWFFIFIYGWPTLAQCHMVHAHLQMHAFLMFSLDRIMKIFKLC